MSNVTVSGLRKSFGPVPVLRGVDLHVPSGTVTAVLGPSGCGKTTLLRLIAGFETPDDGLIEVGGTPMARGGGRSVPPERRRIGYVAQEGALFPHLSVAQNITFGVDARGRGSDGWLYELLEMVGLGAAFARRYPHELSGGQQQRVALARALAVKPGVVLLDEPFSSLDAGLRESTRAAVVKALAAAGTTGILVTHDQPEALSVASQVAVMQMGQLVQVGAPMDLYVSPVDLDVARFLGEAVVLPAVVRGGLAVCELGHLPVRGQVREGPADVMIRPEQVVIRPVGAGGGASARVIEVTYYGPQARLVLTLGPSGTGITASVPGFAAVAAGADVCVAVEGQVTAYTRSTKSLD